LVSPTGLCVELYEFRSDHLNFGIVRMKKPGMKSHHIAALALVGCTLVYPPYDGRNDALDTNRPLKEWYVVSDF
jgi:hypothetical protein